MSSEQLPALAKLVRWLILRSTSAAGSGHATSSLSAVELMVGLVFGGVLRADLRRPNHPNNDRLIFSKGHAAPLLYALYAAAGRVPLNELTRLRKFGSRLEGHPMPTFPYTEAPTGSLGQGLSVGVGMALAAGLDRLSYRTYVLLGDSEMSEGSIWEAIQFAGFQKLANLTAILDVNRLGQSGPTMLGHNLRGYVARVSSFGWRTIMIDGHDFKQILAAYQRALVNRGWPVMIVAKTIKGQGVPFVENKNGWHGKALSREEFRHAVKLLGPVDKRIRGSVAPARPGSPRVVTRKPAPVLSYAPKESVAPRLAFGRALVRLANRFPETVVLDGEVKNSTFTELFAAKYPRRFFELYVAEQNLVGASVGLAVRGKLPVAATFAAFFTRAHDQLRMAAYAGTHQVYAGTHVGVSIGEDGPSQMGLEDLALFRSLFGSVVLYPADAVATERLTELALRERGLVYLRLTRNPLPVIYRLSTRFVIGGSQVVRQGRKDRVTLVAAGVTLHEALAAADQLVKRKISVRVIDAYSVKPIDAPTLRRAARTTGRLIVVEDHVPEGGLADAVRGALGPLAGSVTSLAVRKVPGSGPWQRLLKHQGIDQDSIVQAVRRSLRG